MDRRGFALVSLLLMLVVLVMMVTALLGRNRAGAWLAVHNEKTACATLVAEAGLADVLANIRITPGYNTDIVARPMLNGQGTYTVRFGTGQSINNLGGGTPVDGVPPGKARIIVDSDVFGLHRRLEGWISRPPVVALDQAMYSSGRIRMQGDLKVSGVKSFGDATQVPASVFSADGRDQSNLVTWQPDPTFGGELYVDGAIKSSSPNANAIQLTSPTPGQPTDGTLINQAAPGLVDPDIVGAVDRHAGATAPTLTPGVTVLGPGDYYVSGDLDYSGDIILDGANLYVENNVLLNGSVQGKGSVYVKGETHLKGSTQVTAGDDNHVALLSHGDVDLSGFDGSKYLRDQAALVGNDPNGVPYSQHIDNFRNWNASQLDILNDPAKFGDPVYFGTEDAMFSNTNDVLGHDIGDGYKGMPPTMTGNYSNPTRHMRELVDGGPPGPTRDFLLEKLTLLRDPADKFKGLYAIHSDIYTLTGDAVGHVLAFLDHGALEGITDASNDVFPLLTPSQQAQVAEGLRATLAGLDFDHPGTAYFSGLVYTNGSVRASGEVTIVGALMAIDDGSQPQDPNPSNPQPGDIILEKSSTVVFVEELARNAGYSTAEYGVINWALR
ncbi:MAG: hypothetical protein AB7S38_37175 [Vulcanimicrobiota bacterium]